MQSRRSTIGRPNNRNDFGIGVICALTLEADAVVAVFDDTWDMDEYGKVSGDPNAYTAGRIGNHNVVLTHLPGMGKSSAASVATSLRYSFPNIHLCLVVGICGGVPTHLETGDEILLGDVIISKGIVQYDLARQLPNGPARKDAPGDDLPRPSEELRAFFQKIEGHGRQQLQKNTHLHLEEICGKEGFEESKYPGATEDKLYQSSYRHKHQDSPDCDECAKCESDDHNTCHKALDLSCPQLKCADGKLVPRKRLSSREEQVPQIHFGRFASGDLVMKSGSHRDNIAKKEKVIAFEMEGAGVWERFPSVVVSKAVCDYADSHKNKKWQGYAAASAAACTKAFLKQWIVADKPEDFYRRGSQTSVYFPQTISKASTVVVTEEEPGPGITKIVTSSSTDSNRFEGQTTPLLQAFKERKLEAIEHLLQTPGFIDTTVKDPKGRGVLHLALGDGKVNTDKNKMALVTKVVRLLCERGADVNAADNSGLRPIHYCAKTMNLSAAKYLLENKAEVNAADSAGHTALYLVAVDGHPSFELAETLIQKGGKLGKKRPNPLTRKASESQRKVRTLVKPLISA